MSLNKKTIEDVNVQGKKVLCRVDFNVPMDGERITDENRINGALPTIKYLLSNGAALILCSHMGKPHNVFNDKIKLNKKEKAKIEKLPEAEQAEATAAALEKAVANQEENGVRLTYLRDKLIRGILAQLIAVTDDFRRRFIDRPLKSLEMLEGI